MALRGVLFDLDNTLYERDDAFHAWAIGFVAERFAQEDAERQDEIVRYFKRIDQGGNVARRDLFTALRLRHAELHEDVDTLCANFYARWTQYMTLPADSLALLDALDERGIPWGIVTNGPPTQEGKIRQMRLHERTECIFISELFGAHKPDPAIFRAAAERIAVPCTEILFVGDNAIADIGGAKSAGMAAAWLHRGKQWSLGKEAPLPDWTLGGIAEVLPLLKT